MSRNCTVYKIKTEITYLERARVFHRLIIHCATQKSFDCRNGTGRILHCILPSCQPHQLTITNIDAMLQLTFVKSHTSWQFWLFMQHCSLSLSLSLTYKFQSTSAPVYLHDQIMEHLCLQPNFMSSAIPLLVQPLTRRDFSRRTFQFTAPSVWNLLPDILVPANPGPPGK